MSRNAHFSVDAIGSSMPIRLSLKDQGDGRVDLVATDGYGYSRRIGIFENGRLGLIYLGVDERQALYLQTHPSTGCLVAEPISC